MTTPGPARALLEDNGLQDSVWGQRIIASEEGTGPLLDHWRDQARDWQTCACGQQSPLIPRDPVGAPYDEPLMLSGQKFFANVCSNKPLLAACTLVDIENRAILILRKVTAKESP